MLSQAGLPLKFWSFAMDHYIYTRNLSNLGEDGKVPAEKWYGYKPSVDHLYPFGIPCVVALPAKDRKADLEIRGTTAIFVGYDDRSRAYRCLDTGNHGLIVSPDVQFPKHYTWPVIDRSRFSGVFGNKQTTTPSSTLDDTAFDISDFDDFSHLSNKSSPEKSLPDNNPNHLNSFNNPAKFANPDITSQNIIPNSRLRERKSPSSFLATATETGFAVNSSTLPDYIKHKFISNSAAPSVILGAPRSWREAINRPDYQAWYDAAWKEYNGLQDKKFIRRLVPRHEVPRGKLVLPLHTVFAIKSNGLENVDSLSGGIANPRLTQTYQLLLQ